MKKLPYNITTLLLFTSLIIMAQKFEKDFTKEIVTTKDIPITLVANYADIEIVEWNKNKIKVDAVMAVDGVSEEKAQRYFNTWDISLTKNNNKVNIVSKSKNFNFNNFNFQMPEISIESLGVLDSMNFSFPEINFNEVLNDSIFNTIYKQDFTFFNLDSIGFKISMDKIKQNQKYLEQWQKANVKNLEKLRETALELALKNVEAHENRMKIHKERMKKLQQIREEQLKKRMKLLEKATKKRNELRKKIIKHKQERRDKINERRSKIKTILKNRNEAKVRTKLIIHVPKGTNFNMNVNYSKISTN